MKLLSNEDIYYYFDTKSDDIKFNTANGSYYLQAGGYYLSYVEGESVVKYTEQIAFSPKPIYQTNVDAAKIEEYI